MIGILSTVSVSARMRMQTASDSQLTPVVSAYSHQGLFNIKDLVNVKQEIRNSSKKIHHNFYTIFNNHFCQSNTLHVHYDVDFFSVLQQDISCMKLVDFSTGTNLYDTGSKTDLSIENQIFREYSLKLVDGFKFIIKIPDKLIHTSI